MNRKAPPAAQQPRTRPQQHGYAFFCLRSAAARHALRCPEPRGPCAFQHSSRERIHDAVLHSAAFATRAALVCCEARFSCQ
ncbi:hypothetical protein HBI80_123210 [Parastagonospora nodorum]|nr:hypothetical protein HBH45_082220 [Parastagonospora nodorum]KAH4155618.1 hypothetical protein HBH44_136140 [Parastagonospora nodorum]KAH4176159.1 hypothetical protein HBH43_054540 [Parastagonospora nodorum]KAH4195718.1 hypothetical protein HBH42_075970 [Parastagonospora nodorum]KAH4276321.1 hypothetical protein HBI04_107070 [Parastagonospora nodorum]